MADEKSNHFGKGIIVGLIIAVILIGGFWWYNNRIAGDKDKVKKSKVEKAAKKDKNEKKDDGKETGKENKKDQGGGEIKEDDLVLVKDDKVKGEVYKNSFNGQNFSFVVFSGWKVNEKEKNKIGLLPKDKNPMGQFAGEIILTFKSNKEGFDFDRYYDGLNDINYFADAAGGFDKMKVNGLKAYRFKDVAGLAKSTVVVVKTKNGYVEFADVENLHQEDGKFEELVRSFEVK